MTHPEDQDTPGGPSPASPEAAPPPPPRRRRLSTKAKLILAAIVVAPVILFALYTLLVLNWSYSEGYRAGVLQKFSRKGYVCRTWEGELALTTTPGVAPTIWTFNVRDDAVARRMADAIGSQVILHYTEHRGIPSDCFATTHYFVDSVAVH